ncbi:hypothetical protein Nmel_000753, partial [Mimus melanotis]
MVGVLGLLVLFGSRPPPAAAGALWRGLYALRGQGSCKLLCTF